LEIAVNTLAVLCLSMTLALVGCRKSDDNAAPATTTETATTPDRVEVLARHLPAAGQADLDADPVIVHFDRFAVTKAKFDPKNLDGGTATIELDLTSIKTGNAERDSDLMSPEYFDVSKFATVTIAVANVKKQAGAKYTADATVTCHGITKTYPVTFTVVATTADTVRVEGEHAFSRVDFGVGIDPATDPTERVSAALIIQWRLTLRNT
jgi:polyisoprenoid-binding protein YceI